MKDKRKKMPDELGECEINDLIVGKICKYKLKITKKTHMYDDVYLYRCVYVDGPDKGEFANIMSYFNYNKVMT